MLDMFEKIFCINLDTRKDRWASCENQFKKFEIKNRVNRFDAIKYSDQNLNKKTISQIGCALSHYRILKQSYNNKYSNVLILEDDFCFLKSPDLLNSKLTNCFAELPEDWDIFYLGTYMVHGYKYKPAQQYSNNLIKINTGFCTHAICYSASGIKKILNLLKLENNTDALSFHDEYEAIDWFFVREFQNKNKCFASNELLCEQSQGFSDIEMKTINYSSNFALSYSLYSV